MNCEAGQVLTNGKMYHERCYKGLLNILNRIDEEIKKNRILLAGINKKISIEKSIIRRLSNYIHKIPSKIKLYESRKQKIIRCINKLQKEKEVNKIYQFKKLTYIYNYFPSRPDDWDLRRSIVLKRDLNICQVCYSSGSYFNSLHVHHRIPLSRGGNNTIDNLITLCEKCHKKAHRVREFIRTVSKDSIFKNKLDLISDALRNNKYIYFSYTKYSGLKSKRSIRPIQYYKVKKTLCIQGYCHLRKAMRTFAIKRMRNIKIVDSPITGYDY
jgi:5-methylcytosine-specific restriction endonuclease McrA